jgi:hypothetical protein
MRTAHSSKKQRSRYRLPSLIVLDRAGRESPEQKKKRPTASAAGRSLLMFEGAGTPYKLPVSSAAMSTAATTMEAATPAAVESTTATSVIPASN